MSSYLRRLVEQKRARQARAEVEAEQERRKELHAEAAWSRIVAEARGEIGPMPRHQWRGTRLRFEMAPGEWGKWVDLEGPPGAPGSGGGGGGTRLDTLPLADQSPIEQMVVRQNNQWRRMGWEEFLTYLTPPQPRCTFVTSDGQTFVTSDGEKFNVICSGS